jgi:hypothetical protein
MEVEFGMAWGLIAILVSIIIISGSIVALVFRHMQQGRNQHQLSK